MSAQGPYSIGGTIWPGLSKLIEEAGEVCQVAGKLIGSSGSANHWDGTDLRVRLEDEIADLMAACHFAIEANDLNIDRISERAGMKLGLFREWHRAPVNLPSDTTKAGG